MTNETTREIRLSNGKFVTVPANAPDLVVQAILEAYHHGYEFGYDKGREFARNADQMKNEPDDNFTFDGKEFPTDPPAEPTDDALETGFSWNAEVDMLREAHTSEKRIAELEAKVTELSWLREKDFRDNLATARNDALDEAKVACEEYKQGHINAMRKHGKSDYHESCSGVATRCIDRILALKTPTEAKDA